MKSKKSQEKTKPCTLNNIGYPTFFVIALLIVLFLSRFQKHQIKHFQTIYKQEVHGMAECMKKIILSEKINCYVTNKLKIIK